MTARYSDNTITSIEDYEKALSQWQMTCLRLSDGPFSVRLQTLELPALKLVKRVSSCGIIHSGRMMSNCYYLLLPQSRQPHFVNGVPVSAGEMYVSLGRKQSSCSFYPKGSRSRWLFFAEEGLERYFSTHEQLGLRDFFQRQLKFNGHKFDISRFNNRLPLLSKLATEPNYFSLSLDGELIESSVFSELWQILESLDPKHTIKLSVKTRRRIVNRAIDYIASDPAAKLTVVGMCESAFCSMRTLQYAFQSILQCSPQQFLRLWIFHAVRKELVAGKHACVSCCLKAFNISNQSRFSKEYQTLFGESPTATCGESPRQLIN